MVLENSTAIYCPHGTVLSEVKTVLKIPFNK
jgi:hypothetical protein